MITGRDRARMITPGNAHADLSAASAVPHRLVSPPGSALSFSPNAQLPELVRS
ncbi:hypothetical protein AB0E77_33725 [Streptomyces sp. NPDC032940]|uniref:hypothetical protein n=1 Tax=Streptomyces sp. NPDC032940 TaxID=3155366 RepID=UPI0033EBB049